MTAYDTPQVGVGILCRVRLHRWDICSWNFAGHQSTRSRRCLRCWRIESQALSYFGKPRGRWAFDCYVIPRGAS
jgi:hypothetical protein